MTAQRREAEQRLSRLELNILSAIYNLGLQPNSCGGACYGLGIARDLQERDLIPNVDVPRIYNALSRLSELHMIEKQERCDMPQTRGPERHCYRLTPDGVRRLEQEVARMHRFLRIPGDVS
jgi:DNA-binding PadR family transcriptional regulator